MKKIFWLNFLFLVLLCFLLTGCFTTLPEEQTTTTDVQSIQITSSSPKSFVLNEDFDISDIEISVNYKNGRTVIVKLNESMLSEYDRAKFNTVSASHTIVIEYGNKTTLYNFSVSEPIVVETYNIYFESNGGSDIESKNTNIIETFTVPKKTGFTFLGWYDNVDLLGKPAIAPIQVSKDTTFFAKWEDNRKWTVRFLDIEGNVIESYTQTVTHGDDVEQLPQGRPVEGYTFEGWNGKIEDITENTIIESNYEKILYTINFYFNYLQENQKISSKTIPYGESLSQIPQIEDKPGFEERWVIRTSMEENGYMEITNQFDSIKANLDVIPKYEVIKNKIIFKDDEQFNGTGTSWAQIEKDINYGNDLPLNIGDNADVSVPAYRLGHTCEWSVTIDGISVNIKDGSTWDNINHQWIAPIEPTNLITIEKNNEIIATIKNQNDAITFQNVKDYIIVEAKYVKNKHNLIFKGTNSRIGTTLYQEININYGSKFCLYKPEAGQEENDIVYSNMTKQDFVLHKAIEDWDIDWYPNAQFNLGEEIHFENGYITVIDDDMIFYCNDIDLRAYEVEFYDWDFENNCSVPVSIMQMVDGEPQQIFTQIVKHDGNAVAPTLSSKYEYGYELTDFINFWYDAPQNKDYGVQYYTTHITKDLKLYAHYKIKNYSITFKDFIYPYDNNGNADDISVLQNPPEVTYYKDTDGNDSSKGFVVMESTYFRNYGYIFDDDEIYFGGDEVYASKVFIEQYEADETIYNNYLADIENIKANIARYSAYIEEIYDYEYAILDYTTTPEFAERYNILKPYFDTFRDRLSMNQKKLQFVIDYKIISYKEGDSMPSGAEFGDENLDSGYRERIYRELKYVKAVDNEENPILDENGNYTYIEIRIIRDIAI